MHAAYWLASRYKRDPMEVLKIMGISERCSELSRNMEELTAKMRILEDSLKALQDKVSRLEDKTCNG